jgi:adenine-specific DNA-methyltransferase
MKIRTEVGEEKLRGGFYTPPALVDTCLQSVERLVHGRSGLRVLEPTAGDGEFIRGLRRRHLGDRVAHIQAVELVADEAAKCEFALRESGFEGGTHTATFLSWSLDQTASYDLAIGNPPFLRFQFVTAEDRAAADEIAVREGISFGGVSNLWIPVFVAALRLLRDGGAFAFVIPTECFTGISGGAARHWLLANCRSLRADLFPPGSFPGVLQEVLVLSGLRDMAKRTGGHGLEIHEHDRLGHGRSWKTVLELSRANWTTCLLEPFQQEALQQLRSMNCIAPLSATAKFEVAAVTGANAFFSVDVQSIVDHELGPWAVPLLPRIKHARGLRYTPEDQIQTAMSGAKAALLDFSGDRQDPGKTPAAAAYLEKGVEAGLPSRFKCRIRDPWYRVPNIRSGRLMMSKRSHRYPHVVRNDAHVVTTDTIYRGEVQAASLTADDFVATFHNSLTLLSAEIEGRSFGGGVLELVPSEISRLLMPVFPGFGEELNRLDALARERDDEDDEILIDETDALIRKQLRAHAKHAWDAIAEARISLLRRRLDRNTAAAEGG